MSSDFSKLVTDEEAKRDRHVSPQQKWDMFQQFLCWTQTQATGKRNTKEACLREQARQLAALEEYRARIRSSA